MTVAEVLGAIKDNYVEVRVNEYRGLDHTGVRYVFEPHKLNVSVLPQNIQNREVTEIVPYWDSISVDIDAID